jgi:tRNA(Arg) A34 adenosine deaminase TadA
VSAEHEKFIREAYRLARRGAAEGNRPFGALLVRDGAILLSAHNTVMRERDCTRHAELSLVSRACRELGPDVRQQSVLYASTEPCVMCAGAISRSVIPVVVYGCSAEAMAQLTGWGFEIACRDILAKGKSPPQVIGPILQEEGLVIHEEFLRAEGYGKSSPSSG